MINIALPWFSTTLKGLAGNSIRQYLVRIGKRVQIPGSQGENSQLRDELPNGVRERGRKKKFKNNFAFKNAFTVYFVSSVIQLLKNTLVESTHLAQQCKNAHAGKRRKTCMVTTSLNLFGAGAESGSLTEPIRACYIYPANVYLCFSPYPSLVYILPSPSR